MLKKPWRYLPVFTNSLLKNVARVARTNVLKTFLSYS